MRFKLKKSLARAGISLFLLSFVAVAMFYFLNNPEEVKAEEPQPQEIYRVISPNVDEICVGNNCIRTISAGQRFEFDDDLKVYRNITDVLNFKLVGGQINVSYKDRYYVLFKPYVIYNENYYTIQEALQLLRNNYPDADFKVHKYNKLRSWKYALNFSNVPQSVLNKTQIGLKRVGSGGLSLADIKIEGNTIIIKDKIVLLFNDLVSNNFSVSVNTTDVLIDNLHSGWLDPTTTIKANDTDSTAYQDEWAEGVDPNITFGAEISSTGYLEVGASDDVLFEASGDSGLDGGLRVDTILPSYVTLNWVYFSIESEGDPTSGICELLSICNFTSEAWKSTLRDDCTAGTRTYNVTTSNELDDLVNSTDRMVRYTAYSDATYGESFYVDYAYVMVSYIANAPPTVDSNTISSTTPIYGDTVYHTLTCSDTDSGDTITAYCSFYKNDVNVTSYAQSLVVANATAYQIINITSAELAATDEAIFGCWCTDGTEATAVTNTSKATVVAGGQSIALTGLTNQTYENTDTPICTGNITSNLYRNDTVVTWNNTVTVFGVAGYEWTCNTTANSNYTAATTTIVHSITQTTPTLTVTGVTNATYPAPETVYITSDDIDDLTALLWRNGTDVTTAENNTAVTLATGYTNYTGSTAGNVNYTSALTTVWNLINKGGVSLNLTLNGTNVDKTYTYPQDINATAWRNSTTANEGNISLWRNGTIISSLLTSTTLSLSENIRLGNATYNYSFTFTASNYSDNSIANRYALVNKGAGSVSAFNINDTYMNFNGSLALTVTADTADTVIAELQIPSGTFNQTLTSDTNYTYSFTKTEFNSTQTDYGLVNITKLYFGGTNYTANSNATTLQLDYSRTNHSSSVSPTSTYNSPSDYVEFTAWYNTTENTSISSSCSVLIGATTYSLSFSDPEHSVKVSTSAWTAQTYSFTVTCNNTGYQTKTSTGSFIVRSGGATATGGGGGRGGQVEQVVYVAEGNLTFELYPPTGYRDFYASGDAINKTVILRNRNAFPIELTASIVCVADNSCGWAMLYEESITLPAGTEAVPAQKSLDFSITVPAGTPDADYNFNIMFESADSRAVFPVVIVVSATWTSIINFFTNPQWVLPNVDMQVAVALTWLLRITFIAGLVATPMILLKRGNKWFKRLKKYGRY